MPINAGEHTLNTALRAHLEEERTFWGLCGGNTIKVSTLISFGLKGQDRLHTSLLSGLEIRVEKIKRN